MAAAKVGRKRQSPIWDFFEYDSVKNKTIYSIGGNSFGKPCQFPFKFGDKWYAECIVEGRSDGQLWCATETDYNTERKWGFCPTKSLTNVFGTTLWIGLNSLDFESGWQWSNGNPFRYLNWAPGHPSLEPGLNCGALNAGKASKWESIACSKKLGYICRKGNSTDNTPPPGKDQPNFCPVAWVPYAGHCYYLQRTKMMWSNALAACHKEGADLASIHNIEEHSFIISQSGYLPTDELWIGLNDQRIQNLFEWSDRTHVTFTKWLAGEPSHVINRMEDCVLIKGKEGTWADHMCETERGYICKKKSSSKPEGNPELVSPGCLPIYQKENDEKKSWFDARDFCRAIGGDLASFHSQKEINKLPLILRTGGLVNRTTTTIKSTVRKVAFIMDASGTIVIVKPTITGFARYQ
ncbi:macrophage mannose receptor 1 [Labeo rohita]|uniref:Macrophage mannose receptor 1 n=1 Tax=Labeo rohita TaxID=84645 RepID=A0A498MEN4_LABRO|nr:macrophage mannose receptor 1 [Labeo rohita]